MKNSIIIAGQPIKTDKFQGIKIMSLIHKYMELEGRIRILERGSFASRTFTAQERKKGEHKQAKLDLVNFMRTKLSLKEA